AQVWLRAPLSGVASRCDVAHRRPGSSPRNSASSCRRLVRSSRHMLSTMQDESLSLTTLLRYASTFQGDSTVSTWTGTGVRTITYRELGAQAAQLANALTGLGVGRGDRVGTFMWNNNEHMVAYIGVPAMGAVLHALNIRLFPEQLVYVANHAEDKVDRKSTRLNSSHVKISYAV